MDATKLALAMVVALGSLAAAVPAAAFPLPEEIEEDTTWTAADSPIRLDASVLIREGVTLTIEPGVRVEAQPWAGIVVLGALRAEGTGSDPVVFTGVDGGTWGGISFVHRTQPRPESAFVHARIQNAGVGLAMRHVAVPIDHTVFAGNGVALEVTNPGADIVFTGNEFYSNGTALSAKTTDIVGVYESDFWDNDVSMLFRAQSAYACFVGQGTFEVHRNDILRGPDSPWFSFDVRTSDGSGTSDMVVDASANWWGTNDEGDIEARMYSREHCCPDNGRAPVQWKEPALLPQTEREPPGPAGTPRPQPDLHGDPAWIAEVVEPDDRDCFDAGTVTDINGRVHAALAPIPERVPVSLVRLARGLCRSWDPDARRFGRARSCDETSYFEVRVREARYGRGRWRVELPRPLPPGRYRFTAGAAEGWDDVARFRVLR